MSGRRSSRARTKSMAKAPPPKGKSSTGRAPPVKRAGRPPSGRSKSIRPAAAGSLRRNSTAAKATEGKRRRLASSARTPVKRRKIELSPPKTPLTPVPDRTASTDPTHWWRGIYLVGTEWENYDSVFDFEWDFSNLQTALAPGGMLSGTDKNVYIFGVTEPQLLQVPGQDRTQIVHVPALIAVHSAIAPPAKLGIKSVQMEAEEFVPMASMKMSWVPYFADGLTRTGATTNVWFLRCAQRRSSLKNLSEAALKRFEYALPYIFLPSRMEEEPEPDTVVTGVAKIGPNQYPFEYDWDMDDYDDYIEEYFKDSPGGKPPSEEVANGIVAEIKSNVRDRKRQIKAARAKKQAEIDAIPPEARAAMDQTRFHKFYPKSSSVTPDLTSSTSRFINRYYGKADVLVGSE